MLHMAREVNVHALILMMGLMCIQSANFCTYCNKVIEIDFGGGRDDQSKKAIAGEKNSSIKNKNYIF